MLGYIYVLYSLQRNNILFESTHLVLVSVAVNQTTSSLQREPTSWLFLAAVEVEEGLDRISADPTTSSASANRTPPVLPVCTWMTLWRLSLKILRPLLDFCPLNGRPRAPPNPPPEDCSLATEAEPPSTARLAFSLHHNLKAYCCPVRTQTHTFMKWPPAIVVVSQNHLLTSRGR